MSDLAPSVLNAAQLQRIESVHRGFFYQHLYVVALILTLQETGAAAVEVETDDDAQLIWLERRLYIQVKTRKQGLQPGDLAGALKNFEALRRLHADGGRAGRAEFLVVGNVAPGPELLAAYRGPAWPADVKLHWPGEPAASLPPPWPCLADAIAWCESVAGRIPFIQIAPQSLVFKLAALVQYAASGAREHRFDAAAAPLLFDQLILQLQDFPPPLALYREQLDEPLLSSESRVQLVVGFSGAGKTSWAAARVLHEAVPAVYFDVGDLPQAAVAACLGREIAARFPQHLGGPLVEAGADVLRRVDRGLADGAVVPIVVLDNAHRLGADTIVDLVNAAGRMKFVLLAQPRDAIGQVESRLGVRATQLQGWSEDTIAAELSACGLAASPQDVCSLRNLTGGVPLYVQSVAHLALSQYGGDAHAAIVALDRAGHGVETAQEILLGDLFRGLDSNTRAMAVVLALARTPLSAAELLELVVLTAPEARAADLRKLVRLGMVQPVTQGQFVLHDAFFLLASAAADRQDETWRHALLERIADMLRASPAGATTLGRYLRWLTLLFELGQTELLTDLATEEWFQEVGVPQTLRVALEAIALSDPLPRQRFWAVDALVFWAYQTNDEAEFQRWLEQQERIVSGGGLGQREVLAFHTKCMVRAGKSGRLGDVERSFRLAKALVGSRDVWHAVRHDYAIALYHGGEYRRAAEIAGELAAWLEHALLIDLRALDEQRCWTLTEPDEKRREAIKHLADALELVSLAGQGLKVFIPEPRRVAMHLYAFAGAMKSAVKTGQNVVDDLLEMNDMQAARSLMESRLLPVLRRHGFSDLAIQVRAQYASVLAYDGAGELALAELQSLSGYDMTPPARRDFEAQSALIEELRQAGWPGPATWRKNGG